MEFQAKIHGIEVKESSNHSSPVENSNQVPMFKDPSEYEGISQTEKENLTKQMMGKHKDWNKNR